MIARVIGQGISAAHEESEDTQREVSQLLKEFGKGDENG